MRFIKSRYYSLSYHPEKGGKCKYEIGVLSALSKHSATINITISEYLMLFKHFANIANLIE
jgi:hypothetical protein